MKNPKIRNKKGELTGESITTILLWIIFIILGAFAVYFIIKKFTA